jgi:DNA mismatch endonuclease (patch repair protein)
VDNLSPEARRRCMSRVKSTDNPLERKVRSALHKRGFRFRTHVRSLPGRPDIALPKYRTAVFVDGDFWHGFNFPKWRHKLAPFWQTKIATNRARDIRNFRKLRRRKWFVVRIWQHQLEADFERSIDRIVKAIAAGTPPSPTRRTTGRRKPDRTLSSRRIPPKPNPPS